VAVITIVVSLDTLGAVKNPLLEIVPALADQVTAVFGLPLILAVNCSCCSDAIVALPGESESAVEAGLRVEEEFAELELGEAEPHPLPRAIKKSKSDMMKRFKIGFLSQR